MPAVPPPDRDTTAAGFAKRRLTLTLVLVFLLLNLIIAALADASCYRVRGDCAMITDRTGYDVAEALIEHGALVAPNDPSRPYTAHAPGYALIMAATFVLFGNTSYAAMVVLQLALLLASGLLLRQVSEIYLPGWGDLAMALLLFNPNALAQVHLVQTNAMEIFFVTAAFAAVAVFVRRPRLSLMVLCGLSIGLAMLVRPMSQFLALILPLVAVLLVALGGQSRLWPRALMWGLTGALLAGAIGLPWMWHMRASGQSFRMSEIAHEHLLFLDSLKYLSPEAPGQSLKKPKRDYWAWETQVLSERHADWQAMSPPQQAKLRRQHILDYYRSFPFETAVFATALAYSWSRFLTSGGEGELHRLLGLEMRSESRPLAFYATKAVALGYAVVLRLLGLLGLIELVRRREYGLLVLSGGLIVLFMAGTFLVGQPRYRLPVESPLMLFALFGLAFCAERIRNWRAALPAQGKTTRS